jgi:hypothetical protein
MVKYDEIKEETALAKLLAQIQGNRDPVSRWEDNKEFLAILEELGEPTTREWAIALLEYTHERCWLLSSGRVVHYDALAFDLMKLGAELKWWVDAQIEARTPSEIPKRFGDAIGEDSVHTYPKTVRTMLVKKEREREAAEVAEHERLSKPAEARANAAMAELTPEQERAWRFGRFFPYPGPYAGHAIEMIAFNGAFIARREALRIKALEEFVANLTTEQVASWGLDNEWILPPPALWTFPMRLAFERSMLVAISDEHEDPRVSFASLLRARFERAVESGELSEETEE